LALLEGVASRGLRRLLRATEGHRWTPLVSIVAISEAEPEIGLLRRRRGDALAMFVEQARVQGDEAEAQRLAAEAAICFETGAEVQRERLARREQTATNEDALLAHLLEQAEAMRAVVRSISSSLPPATLGRARC
jgi:hypothetical protein